MSLLQLVEAPPSQETAPACRTRARSPAAWSGFSKAKVPLRMCRALLSMRELQPLLHTPPRQISCGSEARFKPPTLPPFANEIIRVGEGELFLLCSAPPLSKELLLTLFQRWAPGMTFCKPGMECLKNNAVTSATPGRFSLHSMGAAPE